MAKSDKNYNPEAIVQDTHNIAIQNNLTPVDYANLEKIELWLNEVDCPVLIEMFFNDSTPNKYKDIIPHKGTTEKVNVFIEYPWKTR